MNYKSTRRLLVVMLIILILLVAAILTLMIMDKTSGTKTDNNSINEAVITPTEEETTELIVEETTPEETTTPAPTVVDLPNEKEMRLYGVSGNTATLCTSYSSVWDPSVDIATFDAFNSNEDEFYFDNYYTVHQEVWNSVDTDSVYKIGYELSFDVNGERRVYTIKQPKDIEENPDLFMGDADNEEVTGYMGVWVYCDIGQSGYYIHLSQSEYSPNTLLTSIKLRPTPQSGEISNCKLKVFSYSSPKEFDENDGHYIGTHGYEIPIINEG